MADYKQVDEAFLKEAMKRAANDAMQVQNASNLSGVVHSWSKMLSETLWPEANRLGKGTDWVNTHPINVCFASKVAALTGASSDSVMSDAYRECMKLAEG